MFDENTRCTMWLMAWGLNAINISQAMKRVTIAVHQYLRSFDAEDSKEN